MANLPMPVSVPIMHDDSSEGSTQAVVSVKFYENFQQQPSHLHQQTSSYDVQQQQERIIEASAYHSE